MPYLDFIRLHFNLPITSSRNARSLLNSNLSCITKSIQTGCLLSLLHFHTVCRLTPTSLANFAGVSPLCCKYSSIVITLYLALLRLLCSRPGPVSRNLTTVFIQERFREPSAYIDGVPDVSRGGSPPPLNPASAFSQTDFSQDDAEGGTGYLVSILLRGNILKITGKAEPF